MRAIWYGMLASAFFSTTFVLNQAMKWTGGYWMYTASLRFLFMIPFLLAIVAYRGNLAILWREMRRNLWAWMGWSFIGFGVMYIPVCFAAEYEPGWLIAGTWQVTIIAGTLLAPLLHSNAVTPDGIPKQTGTIHWRSVSISVVILLGIAIMQISQADHLYARDLWLGVAPVIIAAFAYPLGNRKMMAICEGRLHAYERVLGMVLASFPLWIGTALFAYMRVGLPSGGQVGQSLLVAVCSGVIATVLFFAATDMARKSAQNLAAVEATQSGEVVFAALGEYLLLPVAFPSLVSWIGMLLVIAGMTLFSFMSSHAAAKPLEQRNAEANNVM